MKPVPNISPGAATDLLVRLIIRVLDASTVSIEIEPAQVLATREYVDRKLDAHNKDGGTHEMLARKSVGSRRGLASLEEEPLKRPEPWQSAMATRRARRVRGTTPD